MANLSANARQCGKSSELFFVNAMDEHCKIKPLKLWIISAQHPTVAGPGNAVIIARRAASCFDGRVGFRYNAAMPVEFAGFATIPDSLRRLDDIAQAILEHPKAQARISTPDGNSVQVSFKAITEAGARQHPLYSVHIEGKWRLPEGTACDFVIDHSGAATAYLESSQQLINLPAETLHDILTSIRTALA